MATGTIVRVSCHGAEVVDSFVWRLQRKLAKSKGEDAYLSPLFVDAVQLQARIMRIMHDGHEPGSESAARGLEVRSWKPGRA